MITVPEGMSLAAALNQIEQVGGGVPMLPLRRTFSPGGSAGLAGGVPKAPLRRTFTPGGSGLEGGVPKAPLRRTFTPGGSGLEGGVPKAPLRRTFTPGGSGMDGLDGRKNKMRWVVLDSSGNPVLLFVGRPRRVAAGYAVKRVAEGESYDSIPEYRPMGDYDSGMFGEDYSMFGDTDSGNDASMFNLAADPEAPGIF